jgi:membrane-associated phospholipid phosphatase
MQQASPYCFYIILLLLAPFFVIAQTPEGNGSTHEKWEYVLEDSGDVLMIALPVAAGITTLFKNDYEGTKQFAFSYATTFVLTHSLKRIIKKERPEGRNLFDAFPSGHTSSAFSGASFIQRRYGWKYGKWAYILAGIVGISRMEGPDGWHDHWDVLAGAIVGIGSTYVFTKPFENQKSVLSFASDGKTYVLSLTYKF